MANVPFQSVDDYIAAQPPSTQKVLRQVRKTVLAAVPDGQEVISYNVPCLKTSGFVLYYAAHAGHWSFLSPPSALHKAFATELAPYKLSKSAIQFPLDKPVPVKLVRALAEFRAAEVAKAKKTAKKR